MPVAGKTVHVRRLVVVRSRCGLEVSPASPAVHMAADREKISSGTDAQLRAASTSAGECGVEDQVGRAGVTPPIRGRNLTRLPKPGDNYHDGDSTAVTSRRTIGRDRGHRPAYRRPGSAPDTRAGQARQGRETGAQSSASRCRSLARAQSADVRDLRAGRTDLHFAWSGDPR